MDKLNAQGRKWGATIRKKMPWKMSLPPTPAKGPLPTRQMRRAECRVAAWEKWQCTPGQGGRIYEAPRDDRGVMRRRIRRSIALQIARDAFRKIGRPGNVRTTG